MKEINKMLKGYITTVEAAKQYGLMERSGQPNSTAIRDLIYSNKVDYIKVDYPNAQGYKYMVNKDSLDSYFKSKETGLDWETEEDSRRYICSVENPSKNSYNEFMDSKTETKSAFRRFKDWLICLLS